MAEIGLGYGSRVEGGRLGWSRQWPHNQLDGRDDVPPPFLPVGVSEDGAPLLVACHHVGEIVVVVIARGRPFAGLRAVPRA